MADALSSTSDRQHRRAEFVRSAGWGDATERLLAGDASFRKYFRLHRGGTTVVVMDSPAAHEPVEPFVRIGRHLRALGLSAPEILAADLAQGFLLLPLLLPRLQVFVLVAVVVAAAARGPRRNHRQAAVAGPRLHGQGEQVVAGAGTPQGGQHHRIELQALGLVHRHHFHVDFGLAIDRPDVAGGQAYQAADDRQYTFREWTAMIARA